MQLLKQSGKSQRLADKIIQFMGITIAVIILYSYFLFILALPENAVPELNFLRMMSVKYVVSILLLFSVIIVLIISIIFKIFEGLKMRIYPIYLKMVQFNSFFLLPIFLFSIGFLSMTFVFYSTIFFNFGMLLSLVGIFLFYIVYFIKIHYEGKIYCMLQMTNYIFDEMSESKKDDATIKKLSRFFIKTVNNIDEKLGKNLNINELKTDENEIPRVKNIIITYLPFYLKYGGKEQIDSLKNHIYSMSLLVDKKDDFSLNIIKILIVICNDIEKAVKDEKFSIIEKGRHTILPIVKDNSPIIFGTFQLIVFMLYLYLYGPSPIP